MSEQSAEDAAIDRFVTKLKQENAALRAERDEYEQQRNRYVLENITLTAENELLQHRLHIALVEINRLRQWHEEEHRQIDDLTAQLAAMTQERDKWNDNHRIMCRVEHELREQLAALQAENAWLKETNSKAVDVLVFEAAEKLNHLQEVNARHVLNRIDIEGQFSDLRAQVTALEQVRDEYHEQWMDASDAEEKLKQQLAQVERERDEWKRNYNASTENTERYGMEMVRLEQQLAASEARCKEIARETWEKAANDLSHGLPAIWKKTLIDRCLFKAKEAV